MSRHRYPVEISRVFERTTATKLQDALARVDKPEETDSAKVDGGEAEVTDRPKKEKQGKQKGGKASESKKNSDAKQVTLKIVLGEALGYGPQLSEHMILDAGLAPNTKLSASNKLDEDAIHVLLEAVKRFEDWLQDIISGEKIPEGYILMQKDNVGRNSAASESGGHIKVDFVLVLSLSSSCMLSMLVFSFFLIRGHWVPNRRCRRQMVYAIYNFFSIKFNYEKGNYYDS
ncbi:unnamed protein product [Linum tenue]|uniref:Uncharacterized protein n=1 Tax=Linum tenue TaxID=586396 RepID=A0AAV0P9R1_9ROSI|nr:unnamed protein product [Linum tenue]